MGHRPTHEYRPHVRWHTCRPRALTVILAGLAAALLFGGCGSGSGDGGAANVPPSPSDVATTWEAQDASSAGSSAVLSSVSFADATHGWAVGADAGNSPPYFWGVILATSDGGATWEAQDASGGGNVGPLDSVTFVNATHGWAVGGDVILATGDGGATWEAQDTGAGLISVSFVDFTHGWAVGGTANDDGTNTPVILATRDGGATWKAQDASSAGAVALLESVMFVDAMHGWAVGVDQTDNAPVIIATRNGGDSWKAQDAGSAGSTVELLSVSFVSATRGWAVGFAGSSSPYAPVIVATGNGGATWREQDASSAGSNAPLNSVAFVDASNGWAVGGSSDGPVILATSDGGTTWETRDASGAGSTAVFTSISFADATHAWAVGESKPGSGSVILAAGK